MDEDQEQENFRFCHIVDKLMAIADNIRARKVDVTEWQVDFTRPPEPDHFETAKRADGIQCFKSGRINTIKLTATLVDRKKG